MEQSLLKGLLASMESGSEIPKGSVMSRELMTAGHLYPQDWREKKGQFLEPAYIEAVTFSWGIKLTSVNITGVITCPTSSSDRPLLLPIDWTKQKLKYS